MSWFSEWFLGDPPSNDLENPNNFFNTLGGQNVVNAAKVTDEQWASLEQEMNSRGLSEAQKASLYNLWKQGGADYGYLYDQMVAAEKDNKSTTSANEAQAKYDEAVKKVMGEYDTAIGAADTRIAGNTADVNRFNKIISVPGAMRSSAEYGNALAGAEAYINAAAESQRKDAAAATAASGMRVSGTAADQARLADVNAASQKSATRSGLLSDALGRRDAYKQYGDTLQQYRDQLGSAKSSLALQVPGQFMNLEQFKLGAMPVFNAQDDVTGPKIGMAQYATGQATSWLDKIFAGLKSGADDTKNTLFQIPSLFRGGATG